MGAVFEDDRWFCVIAVLVSRFLDDMPWFSNRMGFLEIVLISLIFALFYGPEPKRISKKVFVGAAVTLTIFSALGNLIGMNV